MQVCLHLQVFLHLKVLMDKPVYLQMQVCHVTVCLQVMEFLDGAGISGCACMVAGTFQ